MTPAARVQAAIEILDAVAAGQPAEKALTRWARASRYAGSKDRAAVRDHVFDVLRQWRSTAALGGGESGRARMLGHVRAQGGDVNQLFSGQGHGPAPLTAAERSAGAKPSSCVARDVPDWLWPVFQDGVTPAQAEADVAALRHRAPVDLRVNLLKTDRAAAEKRLAQEGIETEHVALCDTVLRVTEGARRVSQSACFQDGWIELQDAASQAVVGALPLQRGQRVLDFCAGGGGKSLAMAAQIGGVVQAHDADPRRMRDLPARARRAGVEIETVSAPEGLFDLVLCDVPCSGSGSWRRAPEAKWRLDAAGLDRLTAIQAEILRDVVPHIAPGGVLAYATCSLFDVENAAQVSRFISKNQEFQVQTSRSFRLADGGDGFFLAVLTRTGAGV